MYEYQGTVINIIDGDTVDIDVDLGFHIKIRERFRLARINCPEMRGSERERGILAKRFAEEWLLGKSVLIDSKGKGKYGRWIAEITIQVGDELKNFNDLLVERGHAVLMEG